jgi:hypothetical protein
MRRKAAATKKSFTPCIKSRAAKKSPKCVAGSASASRRFYRWKKQFSGLGLQELRELRSLRHENTKLKQVVADLTFDRHILQEIVRKVVKPRPRCTLAEWAQATYRLSQRRRRGSFPCEMARCGMSNALRQVLTSLNSKTNATRSSAWILADFRKARSLAGSSGAQYILNRR